MMTTFSRNLNKVLLYITSFFRLSKSKYSQFNFFYAADTGIVLVPVIMLTTCTEVSVSDQLICAGLSSDKNRAHVTQTACEINITTIMTHHTSDGHY